MIFIFFSCKYAKIIVSLHRFLVRENKKGHIASKHVARTGRAKFRHIRVR